jgi:hypothetical protein
MRFTVRTERREQWHTLMTLLLTLGYVWHRNIDHWTDLERIESRYYPAYPHININPAKKSISGNANHAPQGFNLDTDYITVLQRISGVVTEITITDVAGFSAVVHKGEVKVGCQTITADKFRDIQEAVKTIRG